MHNNRIIMVQYSTDLKFPCFGLELIGHWLEFLNIPCFHLSYFRVSLFSVFPLRSKVVFVDLHLLCVCVCVCVCVCRCVCVCVCRCVCVGVCGCVCGWVKCVGLLLLDLYIIIRTVCFDKFSSLLASSLCLLMWISSVLCFWMATFKGGISLRKSSNS